MYGNIRNSLSSCSAAIAGVPSASNNSYVNSTQPVLSPNAVVSSASSSTLVTGSVVATPQNQGRKKVGPGRPRNKGFPGIPPEDRGTL